MENYVNIPLRWLSAINGNEVIVYAYLHGFLSNGREIHMTQEKMADNLNMPLRTFKGVLKRLQDKGFVSVTIKGGSARIALSAELAPSAKVAPAECQSCTEQGAELAPTECQSCTEQGAELAPLPIYKKEDNKENNKSDNKRENKAEPSHMVSVKELYELLKDELSGDLEKVSLYTNTLGLTQFQVIEALKIFNNKLLLDNVTAKQPEDYRKHFNNWLAKNAKQMFSDRQQYRQNSHLPRYSPEFMARLHADITSGH